ncbi:MAG: ATP-binding protein, partial [Chloroflexia bacterium]
PFIGREGELSRIIEQLDSPDYFLVTIIGPGGMGKTRLALQVAAAQVGAFDDGVFWVPLVALDSPELVTSAIAQAVGLRFEAEGDPRAQLLDYLRDSEMLLVLDNFEQLLGAGGNTATDLLLSILKSAPRISMLVTSRERLGLQAEFLLDLAGLNLPGGDQGPGVHGELMQFDAVQLFVERAQQSHSQFALSNDTAQGVVDICTLVEGLPLGIILAAASTRQFSPARIAEAIRTNLDFLTSSLRDATPQHRSLRAVFNHSWDLLTEEEQRVFRGLSVFRGGWEEEAAETILGSGALYPLLSLVDKSLLRRDASGRLEMHEVLRQYATEKLAELPEEQDDIRRRHAAFYLDLARSAEQGLKSDKQGEWLERLEREHDNLRAVLYWAREHGEVLTGLQLGGALWRFWYVRGYYSEGSEHLASVLAMPVTTGPAQDAPQSPPTELARARATVLNAAGVLTTVQGNPTVARSLYEESLALSRDLEDKQGMASSLSNLAIIAHQEGASDAARALQEESLALRRGLGDKQGIAASLNNLGLMAQETGDHARAHTLHEESLALRRELGDTLGIASSLGNLGLVAQELGDYTQARALYQESLTIRRGLGDKAGMAELFTHLGSIAQKQGDYDAARDLYEQGLTLAREMGYRWSIALLLNHLGLVAQELGDYDRARALHEESLTLRRDLGERAGIIGSIISLAAAIARKAGRELERAKEPREPLEQLERAATLFGAADTLLESTPSVLSSDDRRLHEQNLALVQSLLNEEAFTKAWELGRGMSLEDAVDYALP